jgi:RNA polymerase sigma-70 factor, ECF subfamily
MSRRGLLSRPEGMGVTAIDPATDPVAAAWREHRGHLVDLAYRTLGDVGEAEDVVQEAYVRFARVLAGDGPLIADARGWLTVVTGRLCLDVVRSARRRREHVSPDVEPPDRAPDPADLVTLDDEVRHALGVVLDRLGPDERVALVLHDVFGLPYATVGEVLDRPVPACRQLASRARRRLAGAAPVGPPADHAVARRFIAACASGDQAALVAVLHPDAWGTAEFGAGVTAPVNHGAPLVAATLLHHLGRSTMVSHPVPGGPAVLVLLGGRVFGSVDLTVDGELVTAVRVLAGRLR